MNNKQSTVPANVPINHYKTNFILAPPGKSDQLGDPKMNKRFYNNVSELKPNNVSDLSKSKKENERKSNFSFSY